MVERMLKEDQGKIRILSTEEHNDLGVFIAQLNYVLGFRRKLPHEM